MNKFLFTAFLLFCFYLFSFSQQPHPAFQNISTNQGLPSPEVYDILLWVGTLNGLNQVNLNSDQEANIETFTLADGLPSNEINDINSSEDQIWVATTKGLVKIPQNLKPSPIAKSVQLEEVYINGQLWQDKLLKDLRHHQNNRLYSK